MKLACFKDRETGDVASIQNLTESVMSDEQIKDSVKKYNESDKGNIVSVVNVKDNSLIAFLVKKCEMKDKYKKDLIADIVCDLQRAIDDLEFLEV